MSCCSPAASASRRSGAWCSACTARPLVEALLRCRSRADMAFLHTIETSRPGPPATPFRRQSRRANSSTSLRSHRHDAEECTPLLLWAHSHANGVRGRRREPAKPTHPRGIFHAQAEAARPAASGRARALGRRNIVHPRGKEHPRRSCYEAGVDVDYSCELGICGECVARVDARATPASTTIAAARRRAGRRTQGHDLLRRLQERAPRPRHVSG